MIIRPQTIVLRGGTRVEVRERHLCVSGGGMLHLIHLTAGGEVLRITSMEADLEPLTQTAKTIIEEAGSAPRMG